MFIFQAATLEQRLWSANREWTLDKLLADAGRGDLVVLDEFDCVPFDVDGVLRSIGCYPAHTKEHHACHKRRARPLRSQSKRCSEIGPIRATSYCTSTIVGCTVQHDMLVEFGGPSHRLKESLVLDKPGSWQCASSETQRCCAMNLKVFR